MNLRVEQIADEALGLPRKTWGLRVERLMASLPPALAGNPRGQP